MMAKATWADGNVSSRLHPFKHVTLQESKLGTKIHTYSPAGRYFVGGNVRRGFLALKCDFFSRCEGIVA